MNEFQLGLSSNSFDGIISALENGFLSKSRPSIPIQELKERLIEFQNFFSSMGPIPILPLEFTDKEEISVLLSSLKMNFENLQIQLDKAGEKEPYRFTCGQCNENYLIDSSVNMWSSLQEHSHFEEAFANKNFNIIQDTNNVESNMLESESTPNMDIFNENSTDSGIEQVENDIIDKHKTQKQPKENHSQFTNNREETLNGEINNFRFNFQLKYDDVIQNKLYPGSFMSSVKKYDKIADYTIMRTGNYRAVCLLCSCDIVSRSKISKSFILDHVMGQRHLRFGTNPANLDALRCFHETWLNFEVPYQAHQIYFKPEIGKHFKCILCNTYALDSKLQQHIHDDLHKRRVIELFDKNEKIFFLNELQVQVYGQDLQIKAQSRLKEVEEKKNITREDNKQKVESEPSPSRKSKEPVHNIIKSVENPNSNNIFDLLPNRMRDHLKYFKLEEKCIRCELCQGLLSQHVNTLKNHIRQTSHVKASDVVPKKYHYYCEICNLKYADETTWNQHFLDGPVKHTNVPNARKEKLTEYECTKCSTVIYGDEISLLRHLGTRRERRSKEIKLAEQVRELFRSKEFIELQGNKLTEESSKTSQYNESTMICCNMLEKALTSCFENCRVYPFGSRISGLGNKFSDLDVFLDIGDMYEGNKCQDSMNQVHIVRKVAQTLYKYHEFKEVCQIPTARTPIVKFHHTLTKIDCDVSFRHGLSVENTKFLRFCIDIQPITQPFILILKKWSEYNKLAEHITTYALAILAIFYLQLHYHLLSVEEIRNLNPGTPLIINGWKTITYIRPLEEMKQQVTLYTGSLHELLRDFFSYFAKFKYSDDVVCPLLGRIIKKKDFLENGKQLPAEMRSYVAQLQRDEPEHFRCMSAFCIQDPFDLSHNLTKALQPGTLNKFKTLCELSVKFLDAIK